MSFLHKAEKTIYSLEKLMYLSYPLLKEKTIILKAIRDLKKIIGFCIRAVLYTEASLNQIRLSNNPRKNLQRFFNYCAPKYQLNSLEKTSIIEILELNKGHRESVMEFKRKEEIVILSKHLKCHKINEKKIKELIKITRIILEKIKQKLRKNNHLKI